jgi:glycosyltransferase involved in cell wall biosynthesis
MNNINKRILLLHSSNDLYGASKIFLKIIQILENKNYEIHIILPSRGPLDNLINNKINKVHYYRLGVLRKKYFNPLGLINRIFINISSICFLSNYIKKHKINLVYTNTSTILSGGIAAKKNNITSLYHIHEMPTNKLYFFIIKRIINLISDKIIAVSDAVRVHWFNSSNNKVTRIYNGFDSNFSIKKYNKIKDTIVITSIARLIPYKGHMYFIKIAKKLIEFNNNMLFYIIGDTYPGYENYENSLRQFVLKNKLEKKIIFTGFKKNVIKYLYKSDFLFHPAIEPDPLPTVIIESILAKVPVIATKLGGAIEILDNGRGGLLVPYNDVNISVNLIRNYLLDSKEIQKKTNHSQIHLKRNFLKENFNENIIKIIEK